MRVRIIGAGNIGSQLAQEALDLGLDVEVTDARPEVALELADRLDVHVVDNGAPLTDVDLVIEAASRSAVAGPVLRALKEGIDCMVLTTGAFLKPGLLDEARAGAEASGARLWVPSGGIAGLDAVKALALEEGAQVTLTTRKPPGSLGLEPDTDAVVFEGTAAEAIDAFPKNINVAASLVLSGIEPTVRIVADPALQRNTHEVTVRCPTVDVTVQVASDPSPANAATSHVAVLSSRALLRRIVDSFQVGT